MWNFVVPSVLSLKDTLESFSLTVVSSIFVVVAVLVQFL